MRLFVYSTSLSLLLLIGSSFASEDDKLRNSHRRTLFQLPLWISNMFAQVQDVVTNPTSESGPSSVKIWKDLSTAFTEIQDDVVWPTPESGPSSIVSTFGPRLKKVDSPEGDEDTASYRYDFHRGVDILGDVGDPILASYDGVVVAVGEFSSGARYIYLEHTFDDSFVLFHGETFDMWYTVYIHLDEQLVSVGDVVLSGDEIAKMGNSGAITPHLHHEVRVGTPCSLEHNLDNPSNICIPFPFDPHVNTFFIYPHANRKYVPSLSIQQEMHAHQNLIVLIQTTDTDTIVNRYDVQVINKSKDESTIYKSHTLDLNLRTGFDAKSTHAIDTVDKTAPYLDPIVFRSSTSEWDTNFIIPYTWLPSKSASDVITITVTTIWGETVSINYGQDITWFS